jgi:hypothetical protein
MRLKLLGLSFIHCHFKGGSSSGGGGGSGQVDYPSYMKIVHEDWLHQAGDTIEASITDIMNAALGSSPFTTAVAFDPTTPLADSWTAVCAFNSVVDALDHSSDWQSVIVNAALIIDGNIITDTYITADINAFADVLDDQITNDVLPRFEAGMRDINAVMSSAFVIGRSNIEGMRDRDVAKYGTDLRVKMNLQRNDLIAKSTDRMLSDLMQRVTLEQAVASLSIEAKRIHIVAMKEKTDQNVKFDEADAQWDLEVFQYGANLMASIGGGTVSNNQKQLTSGQSALSGALSGAAVGAQVGGVPGALVGGIIGLGAGLLLD